MVIADMMDIKNILKDFSRLAEARKNHTFRTRLVFIFCAATIAMVLFFSYRVVNSAMDKILVVNEGGELLRFKAMQQDLLYESLFKEPLLPYGLLSEQFRQALPAGEPGTRPVPGQQAGREHHIRQIPG